MERTERDKRAVNSTKLLRIERTRQFSDYTTDLISDILGPIRENPIQHGKMVIRILDILENNDTEEKIDRELEAIMKEQTS